MEYDGPERVELVVEEWDGGKRLDRFLASRDVAPSRSLVQKLIAEGRVWVCGTQQKSSYTVRRGDVVEVELPEPARAQVEPEPIELEVVYEDQDLLVINKQKDLVVHPAPGHSAGTLVNALMHHCDDLSGVAGVRRPGIVHRLDKDTTGLLVVAKNDYAHLHLARQLKMRQMKREYQAIVRGRLRSSKGVIEAPVGRHPVDRKRMAVVPPDQGRHALTRFWVMERFREYTLIRLRLSTGRTHQIRVHMAYIGHPVAGDPDYAPKSAQGELGLTSQALHAGLLGFEHPRTGEYMEFTAPLPDEMEHALELLRQGGEAERLDE